MDNTQTIGIVTPNLYLVTYGATHEKPRFEKFTHEKPQFVKCTHEFIKEFFTLKLHTTAGDPQFSEAGIPYCFFYYRKV